jgi:hypothetical protein
MIMMSGLGDGTCASDSYWDASRGGCVLNSFSQGNNCGSGMQWDGSRCIPNAAGSTPWWQSLVTGFTQGAVTGLVQKPPVPGMPLPGQFPMPAPQPWYTTSTGMIGIGIGVIALFFLMKK